MTYPTPDEWAPADDMATWGFVWTRAQEGSALHKKALDLVEKHNPQEFAAIKEWCEA